MHVELRNEIKVTCSIHDVLDIAARPKLWPFKCSQGNFGNQQIVLM